MGDRIGQQFGNYRLTRLLGEGGFAEVYLAVHLYLDTQVAVKVLHSRLAREDIEPFRTEARTIAHLEHPHIVRVLDFGVEGTIPYLVMSYASNGSLRQRHPKRTVLPLATIVAYVSQITQALQYAHDQKVIHRDVKPENMLLGPRDEVLLSDFGIALLAQSSRSQSIQEIAGTAAYMAPEQFQGKPRPASDQYALGVVVYEWLSGMCPFHGSFTEIASQHLFVPPPPLLGKAPAISSEIEDVVLTALAKNPRERFGNIRAFATALDQAYQSMAASPAILSADALSLGQPPLSTKRERVDLIPLLGMEAVSSEQSAQDVSFPGSSLPTELVTPPNIPAAANALDSAPIQDSSSPTTMTPPRPPQAQQSPQGIGAVPSPIETETGSIPSPQPAVPTSHKGLFKNKNVLLIVLVLLVIGGSAGILSSPLVKWIYPITTHPTVTHPAASANAPMFGFNAQHTNFNPDEHILNVTNVSQLRQAWTYPGSFANPVVANSIIYLSSYDHNLYALNASTGTLLWKVPIGNATSGSPAFYASDASPAVVNGIVYVGSDDHNLYAFNASTGALLWKTSARGTIYSSLVVADGAIYADVDDNNLYAFNASTGSILWSVAVGTGGAASNPAVAQGIVYIGSTDRKLYAFKASTGAQLWAVPTDGFAGVLGGSFTASSPAVADGIVYVGSSNPFAGPAPGNLYAFNASTGALLWKVHVSNNNIEDTPAVANGIVYVGSEDFRLRAFDAKTGAVKWATATQSNIHNSSPTVANGVVYISSWDKSIYAFNAQTGVILWKT